VPGWPRVVSNSAVSFRCTFIQVKGASLSYQGSKAVLITVGAVVPPLSASVVGCCHLMSSIASSTTVHIVQVASGYSRMAGVCWLSSCDVIVL
jgi:hypothetical protein